MSETESKRPRVLRRSDRRPDDELRPIVLDYKEIKKSAKDDDDEEKERYSRGFEDIQRMEGDVIRVARRASRAVTKGLDTYDSERRRSAKKKKDGAIEDFFHNSAKAASASMKEASEIPVDIAESISRKSYRKLLRKRLRRASKFFRVWRI